MNRLNNFFCRSALTLLADSFLMPAFGAATNNRIAFAGAKGSRV